MKWKDSIFPYTLEIIAYCLPRMIVWLTPIFLAELGACKLIDYLFFRHK